MIMQKKSNNFYNKNEKKAMKLNKDKEQNYIDDKNYKKYSKYQFTEAKTYNKNKINSPYITDKKNYSKNNDIKNFDKLYIYESGNKTHYFKSNLIDYKNNTFNARNTTYLNPKSYTYYNYEKGENYYSDIQNKIYKKVVEQIVNNLSKYCKTLIFNEFSKFLKILKKIKLQNESKPKTYKKKYISNKIIYKAKKTPDKFNQNKRHIANIISPLHNYKALKTENDNFISQRTSVNNSSKKNVIYSNYYNLNFFENNTNNNKYIYSTQRNKRKISNDFIYNSKSPNNQKEINIIPNINFVNDNEIINNELNIYEKRKFIIKTNLRKNNNNNNLTQSKNFPNNSSIGKNNLKIDSKNSLTYINYSTKKKMIDKLQNIKLFRQVDNKISYKNLNSSDLDRKKIYFQDLWKKLKIIAFYKHIEKIFQCINNKNKQGFFEILKNGGINKEDSKNINKKNINKENDDIIENVDENKNFLEDKKININSNEDDIDNMKEIEYIDYNIEDNITPNIKNIEITSNEKIEKNLEEKENNNKIEDIKENNTEILEEILNKDKVNKIENNLEINPEIISDEKIINENENIQENSKEEKEDIKSEDNKENINEKNEEKNEDINLETQLKENNIENEIKENIEDLNNSINNKKDNEERSDIYLKNNEEKEDYKNDIITGDNDSSLKNEKKIEEEINKRNIAFKNIFEIISLKEKYNILKESFYNWKQIININNNMEQKIETENEIINLINENKEEKRNHIKIKTLFFDEVDDEEKKVILEEMVFRFRTLLMSTSFHYKESFSDYSD